MPHLLLDPLPNLREPVLLAAFAGWNDAGEAATAALRWLVRHLVGRRVGGLDPEEFHVFTDTRPHVRLVDGERRISWPAHELFLTTNPALPRDLLLFVAREPELRWRTYCDELIDAARRADAGALISFGAFLADTPHTRPVPISGFATSGEWLERLRAHGAMPSDYQGPTGIVGVLHDRCREAGLPSASLWAAVPHYLPTTANPKAALALLRVLDGVLELGLDLRRLEAAAAFFERQVDEAVGRNRRAGSYVRDLERRADAAREAREERPPETSSPLPSAEEIIKDLEDFLRGRSSGSEG
jgi:proteasome assembly chaperone (PAC2) family protein